MFEQLKELYRTNKVFAFFAAGMAASSVLLAVFLLAVSAHQVRTFIGGTNYQYSSSISVEGVAKEKYAPDVATFSFGVNEENKSFEASQKAASDKVAKAVEYLKNNGVEEKDINTASLSTNEVFDYPPCTGYGTCPQPTSRGFGTYQDITVKVRDISKVGELVGGLGQFNLSYVGSVSHVVDDMEGIKNKARLAAIEDARSKAEELADALGVRIVRLTGFYDNNVQPYPYYDGYGGDMMKAESASTQAVEVPVGEGEYEARVNVMFDIR